MAALQSYSRCSRITGPTLQIYLPRFYVRFVDDADTDDINLGRIKLKLKNLALVGLTHAISLHV